MSITGAPWDLDHSFARELPALSVPWTAAPAPDPRLAVFNDDLAAELGLDAAALRADPGLLVGASVPDGWSPVAQAYAGHQFGGYVPRLGDGRALLLGELVDRAGRRRDLHLKGSGRTPFARGGDGRAALGPMLREYLMGEAMHALEVPTTRGLAVTATGEPVARETMLPGAVLARVASSHLRVGSFQFAAASGEESLLRDLADYTIARHHPDAADAPDPYLELYRRVIDAQASLVARWMLVGFVHGVLNTDNMALSGETIDYGPCAFLDAYDPAAVFSSIDHAGRYAFGNQPRVAQWNLARFGETLLPLLDAEPDAAVAAATEALHGFGERYAAHHAAGMSAKLGVVDAAGPALGADLLELLAAQRIDLTGAFRALSAHVRGDPAPARALFADPAAFDEWARRWQRSLPADRAAAAAAMDRANPVHVPRNHLVEEALTAATGGDLAPLHRLLDAVGDPFTDRPELRRYAEPAPADTGAHVTYCGT